MARARTRERGRGLVVLRREGSLAKAGEKGGVKWAVEGVTARGDRRGCGGSVGSMTI